jgi:hypothetical protein
MLQHASDVQRLSLVNCVLLVAGLWIPAVQFKRKGMPLCSAVKSLFNAISAVIGPRIYLWLAYTAAESTLCKSCDHLMTRAAAEAVINSVRLGLAHTF